MRIEDVHQVLVIGGGTMGLEIGLQAATHGYPVVLYETDAAAWETAPQRLRGYAETQVSEGILNAGDLAPVCWTR
jgi:3-hydroxybutyryl-CoA dehydrogenase